MTKKLLRLNNTRLPDYIQKPKAIHQTQKKVLKNQLSRQVIEHFAGIQVRCFETRAWVTYVCTYIHTYIHTSFRSEMPDVGKQFMMLSYEPWPKFVHGLH
jgi:hypothetical protein